MGKIYVVGLGPGAGAQMTAEARNTLAHCQVIVGYPVYLDLIREEFAGKRFLSTPMRQEETRCRMAFAEAAQGAEVAVVCSGDAGVYGMAGLMYEIGQEYPQIELEIVPGITAAIGGAAVLGAPLMHDFAVISLSDLLTPWEKIERRLRAAATADFVICLYNPSSKKRKDYLKKACEIMLEYKCGRTVCGLVRNIGREGEYSVCMTLDELKETEADMFTTVYIGNEQTREMGGKMVTPRGYRLCGQKQEPDEIGNTKGTKISIRAYEKRDAAEVTAIWNRVVEDGVAFPQLECLNEETGDAFFSGQSFTGVAYEEETNEIVGMYILHPNNVGRCGHLCNASYAVKADCRGQHIGERLVRHCIAKGKELGFGILQFNAVVQTNTAALNLYKKLGFTQLGVIPNGFMLKDGTYENIIPHYIEL